MSNSVFMIHHLLACSLRMTEFNQINLFAITGYGTFSLVLVNKYVGIASQYY